MLLIDVVNNMSLLVPVGVPYAIVPCPVGAAEGVVVSRLVAIALAHAFAARREQAVAVYQRLQSDRWPLILLFYSLELFHCLRVFDYSWSDCYLVAKIRKNERSAK